MILQSSMRCQYIECSQYPPIETLKTAFRFTPLILSYFFLSIREAHRADIEGSACVDESGIRSAMVFAPEGEDAITMCENHGREVGEHYELESEGTVV